MATGVGASALCLKTGAVFGTLGRRDVFTAGCVSLILAAFLYFMGVGLPPTWQPVFVALLPFASAFLYIMPSEDPFTIEDYTSEGNPGKKARRAFVCLVIAAVMIAATAGFAKGLVSAGAVPDAIDRMGSVSTFAIFCGAVAISFLVNCGEEVKMVRLTYAVLIVFGVTEREAEVLELFASGRSANWIAEDLVISKNTVRSHLRSVYTKLDVHTRQELLDFLKTISVRE